MNDTIATRLTFRELEQMDAPSWDSFYKGVISALVVIGIGAAAAT